MAYWNKPILNGVELNIFKKQEKNTNAMEHEAPQKHQLIEKKKIKKHQESCQPPQIY